jgi:hypothetical protein
VAELRYIKRSIPRVEKTRPGLVYYTFAKINLIREVEKVDIALEYFPHPPSKKCENLALKESMPSSML